MDRELVSTQRLIGLRGLLGPERLSQLLDACDRRLQTLSDELRLENETGVDAIDREPILRALHRVRGSCSSLALDALASALQRIRREAAEADDAQFVALCRSASDEIERLGAAAFAEIATNAHASS